MPKRFLTHDFQVWIFRPRPPSSRLHYSSSLFYFSGMFWKKLGRRSNPEKEETVTKKRKREAPKINFAQKCARQVRRKGERTRIKSNQRQRRPQKDRQRPQTKKIDLRQDWPPSGGLGNVSRSIWAASLTNENTY